jgi:hypothetical protein
MARRRDWRLHRGLPRGGLGRIGWVPALAATAAGFLAQADLAALTGSLVVPLCVWCALGLRKDDQAGELSDYYVDDESLDWKEALSGNFTNPVRRHSNGMIVLAGLGCAIAWCRWLFGFGPLA